ncbi:VWA domain-containing protein [Hydrogenophilus islandicus]
MEEWVGALWDRWITKVASRNYPDAAVTLAGLSRALALFYRGCGGIPGRVVKPAVRAVTRHRRRLIERIAGVGDRYQPATIGADALYLPSTIDWFPEAALNRDAYFWLALVAAHFVPNGEPIWLANQRAAAVALARFPGWERRYQRLVDALLAHRPEPTRLSAAERAVEEAIRDALRQPGSRPTFPPDAKRPPFPVWLWLHEEASRPTEMKRHREAAENDGPKKEQENPSRTMRAERTDAPKEEHGMLLIFRAESLLSWAEYVRVNRSQDDEPEEDPLRAAETLDTLHFANDDERVAARVRIEVETPPGSEEPEALSGEHLYPEWDYRSQTYRENHCRVVESRPNGTHQPTEIPATLRPLIRRLRAQLELLAPVRVTLTGQPFGDEIDLDRFVRFRADRAAGTAEADRGLYLAKRAHHRDIATLLLADTSLSTDAHASDDVRVIDLIRDTLWVFSEAIAATGDSYAIAAFSSLRRTEVKIHWLKTFAERRAEVVRSRIAALAPGYYTRMGAAVRAAVRTLQEQPQSLKLLLLLSDGKPHDLDGYEGRYAIEDCRMAIQEARSQGVRPFCLTIDKDAAEYLPYLFGQAGYLLIPRMTTLAERLPKIYALLTDGL